MKNPNIGQIFTIPSDKTLPQVFTITPRQREITHFIFLYGENYIFQYIHV